jgi:hypothetical protein
MNLFWKNLFPWMSLWNRGRLLSHRPDDERENTVEEIKHFVLKDNAVLAIDQYRYRIRFPFCSGRKGLYFVTAFVSGRWCSVGHFWCSTLVLLRGMKSEFSRDAGPVGVVNKFFVELKYGKLSDQLEILIQDDRKTEAGSETDGSEIISGRAYISCNGGVGHEKRWVFQARNGEVAGIE